MNLHQKLGIGVFLTMNIWLIIVALVRVTSFKQGNSTDETWSLFFQFLEPNIAILVTCFSAFRSLFVSNVSKDRGQRDQPLHLFRQNIFRRTPPDDSQQFDDLPSIPRPTLNGMRTMIWKNNRTNISSVDSDATAINPNHAEDKIDMISERGKSGHQNNFMVKYDLSLESTRVTHPIKKSRLCMF